MEKNNCESCGVDCSESFGNSGDRVLCPTCDLEQKNQTESSNMAKGDMELASDVVPLPNDSCSICLKVDQELLPTDDGMWLCPTCIVDYEEDVVTVVSDSIGTLPSTQKATSAKLCDHCNCESDELLPSTTGRLLCPGCIMEFEENVSTQVLDDDVMSPQGEFEI